jgi:hypothetical protein
LPRPRRVHPDDAGPDLDDGETSAEIEKATGIHFLSLERSIGAVT